MQAIKRTAIGLILSVLLLGGLVGSASPAIAAPAAAPMPTVELGWNWWIMGGWAKFDHDETSMLAQMSVGAAAAWAASKIPSPIGKIAAAALGTGLWLEAKRAVDQGGCLLIVYSVLYRNVQTVSC